MFRSKTMTVLGLGMAVVLATIAPATAHDSKHGEKEPPTVAITLTDAGYEPASIELVAGQTVHLAFRNEAKSSCATSVESKDLAIPRTALPKDETTVVEITPKQAGEYTFACASGMVKGTVVVKGS